MHTNAVSHAANYQTLQLFRMEDITMSLDDRVASATGVIMDLFEEMQKEIIVRRLISPWSLDASKFGHSLFIYRLSYAYRAF